MPSVSQAKNIMRRTLSEIVDSGLTRSQKDELWLHFDGKCAFCAEPIDRSSRTGHVDHLETDGGNGPRNRVLACARCNGDEKRDRDWREFLDEKSESVEVLAQRRSIIDSWVSAHPQREHPNSTELDEALQEAERLVEAFHSACNRLREAVKTEAVKNRSVP
jgi:hypothetical protein